MSSLSYMAVVEIKLNNTSDEASTVSNLHGSVIDVDFVLRRVS